MAINQVRSQEWIDRIEDLVHQAESLSDPRAREITVNLLQAVLDFHGAGLERALELVDAEQGGSEIIERLAADDLISSMLLLHNLHPDDLATRLNRALEKLQEVFAPLGAKLSLVSMDDETVRVLFDSSRTWSANAVRSSIQDVIFHAAPEIGTITIEGLRDSPPANFVPVSELLAGLRV